MARIRTIKPEFPQSESIGRLSRDARLLYIMLFTIVDDEGRARAASRMLASLLYPYDADAGGLIDKWMAELERGDHIRRYEVDGSQYLEIVKWLIHQKIDKPSKSRLPKFDEASRIVSKPREESATYLVSSTLDLVPSIGADAPRIRSERKNRKKGNATPLPDGYLLPPKVESYALSQGLSKPECNRDHQRFCNHAKQNDRRCVDWEAAERNWMLGSAERLGRTPIAAVDANGLPFDAPQIDWPFVMRIYAMTNNWNVDNYGPEPGEPNCRVPKELLDNRV